MSLTRNQIRDIGAILDALNSLDRQLDAEAETRDEPYDRAEVGLAIEIVDGSGDRIARLENEIGPGYWSLVALDDGDPSGDGGGT